MKDKFSEKIIIFTWIVFLFVCLGLLSFTSHAASDQDFFPMEQNKNGHFNTDIITGIANYFDDENYYIICYYQNYNYFLVRYPKSEKQDGMLCGEKSNDLTYWSLYKIGSITTQFYQFQWSDYGEGVINLMYYGNNAFGYWVNLPSSNYNSGWDYISNFIVFTNNTAAKQIVLLYDVEPEYTDPDNDTYPNNFDKPNIDDYYDPDSAPGFDGSSVEKAVESLYSLLKWYFQDPNGLPGLFRYIIDNTNWAIQKVINNIRDVIFELQEAIEDFVDSINGWLSDIKDQIDYIIEPVDSEIIYDNISGTSLVGNITTIQTSLTSFQNSFSSVSEPTEYKIPIHLENLPTDYFGIQTVQYLDLGIINGDIKAALRIFVWAMVTYGLVITIFDSISNYINAGGDES